MKVLNFLQEENSVVVDQGRIHKIKIKSKTGILIF